MAVPKLLLTLILGLILTLCPQCIVLGQSLDWQTILQADVDIYNSTSLDQYAFATRRKYTTQARSSSPNMTTSDTLAASFQDSFRGISLRPRQACTGDVKNYCFGNTEQYCANCGICCSQSAGPWCCITNGGAVTKYCCPADTGLNTGHQGCCDTWQSCRDDTGCTDPSTTITTTVISWITLYTTSTVYTTRFSTSTYIASAYTTVYTTVSNVRIATEVDYVTVTAKNNRRHRRGLETAGETNRAHPTSWTKDTTPTLVELDSDSDSTRVMSIQAPIITVLSYPELDLVARDLEVLGVIVKRQNTITITVTVTSPGTTVLASTFYSTVVENVVATSTTNVIITSTTYLDAQTTTRVTSTITTSVAPDPETSTTTNSNENSSTSTSTSAGLSSSTGTDGREEEEQGGGGLSTAAQAGIGVGTAAGSSIICIILLFWWRRRRRAQKDGGARNPPGGRGGAAAMAQGAGPNPSSNPNSNSPPLYTAIGAKSELQSESTLQHNNGAQRQSFIQPSSPSTGVGSHSMSHYSYEPVNRSDGLAEVPVNEGSPTMGYRPPQSPSPQFMYAPYELYDERSHELNDERSHELNDERSHELDASRRYVGR